MPVKVCVSVAVSKPQGLEQLPGAIEASGAMLEWAKAAGFTTESVTDAAPGALVTVAGLRATFRPILMDREDVIDHLIFHFAGHGVAAGAEDQFLLLSNWRTQPDEAIRLGRFVRLLQYYQPTRVSLFIDACRSAANADAEELNGSGILDRPEEEAVEFLEDRFRAAKAWKASYMIHDAAGGVSRCLFSSVLLKALCGKYAEAIDTRGAEKVVTSAKIYGAVNYHLPLEAARYHVTLEPSLKPSFIAPNDVYTHLPIAFEPPELPEPWFPPSPREGVEDSDVQQRVRRIQTEYAAEQRPTHFETGAGLAVFGDAADPILTPPARVEFDKLVDNGTWWRFAGPGYELAEPASLVVATTQGGIIGAAAIPGMIVTISIGRRIHSSTYASNHPLSSGATSVIYRPVTGRVPEEDLETTSHNSEDIIARMRAGDLTAEEVLSIAVRIRGLKHVNPMLGAIAAYLYDAVGDRDSIRRIAWFYAWESQPIPFDVALLADLKGERGEGGRLRVSVPAVSQRTPRTPDEAQHADYFCATTEVSNVVVAGGFPWLRQGWSLLDVVGLPVHEGLVDLASALLPFPFTTLEPDAGRALAALVLEGKV